MYIMKSGYVTCNWEYGILRKTMIVKERSDKKEKNEEEGDDRTFMVGIVRSRISIRMKMDRKDGL
uniref:Uncharacterized protein n=1 Tax=Pristionchus pacificus TaxID=54126 RepID=A0A2A6CC70_PRIPA|eukprot:PDM75697.1 hypothetical protein PRIPAC_43833 [Pristionchus pacificus]